MSGRYITLKQLQERRACLSFVATFKQLFPSGRVRVTPNTVQALAQWANFHWLVDRLLSVVQRRRYWGVMDGPVTGGQFGPLRSLVPNFEALPFESRNRLMAAFRALVCKDHNTRMANAFEYAYNSRK
jgi:hypothetical protein